MKWGWSENQLRPDLPPLTAGSVGRVGKLLKDRNVPHGPWEVTDYGVGTYDGHAICYADPAEAELIVRLGNAATRFLEIYDWAMSAEEVLDDVDREGTRAFRQQLRDRLTK